MVMHPGSFVDFSTTSIVCLLNFFIFFVSYFFFPYTSFLTCLFPDSSTSSRIDQFRFQTRARRIQLNLVLGFWIYVML